ncbi:UDP-N-acetylmuramoyl-L-alanine--D-glutamate ligase [Candidatus Falkowbacteria bacterium HGW-Falkowbacteria-1]|uniref:UDP-N-acetylmuramoylalanine--D-glutamate ligase n=1 Tax=Candidatus Falkowbacteria bacterium HGW-Falkowbacteria-1 TaxID=2013768 RepID=A0A2N2E8K9_9BACT|nr:MAG: UDP-N-acetylmuramoyl-L-alanine--D-glutamate ligase [Candidatus Falkowbacteria bacterium HGW-Falkowbacteria-1]
MKNLENKKIALLGLGIENQSLLKFLLKKNKDLDISICDKRTKSDLIKILQKINIKNWKKIKFQTENKFNIELDKFNILFRSPGWPILCPGIQKAIEKNVELSSAMNLFFELCPSKNIIGVSGSKGKGTTASLIYEIIKNSGKKCFLGGNIGIAPFDFIEKIKKNDFVILELSSFQLEDLNYSPKIAVLSNIFKEHLSPADPNNPNFHKNFESYTGAKMNITAKQSKGDYLVANQKIKIIVQKYKIKSKIIYFTKSKSKNILAGDFNKENIAAAEKVATLLKINKSISQKTIKNFKNLEHRLELVRILKNVTYYDNSFSTTPESTIADLQSFKKNIILLAGGSDKGANFKKLAKEIKKRVKLILFFPGQGSERMHKELNKINFPKNKVKMINSMTEAVISAYKKSQEKDTILLSTACASFGIFKNYKERGNLFKDEVKKL